MNERIKELYDQCWFGYDDIAVYQKDLTIDDSMGYCFDTEKFAELIVRECARVARATPCPYEEDEVRQRLGHTWDMASVEAGSEIVKYFGVK